MRRPNRAVCVLVVGLAVLVGCAKKKKTEPEVTANTNPVAAPSAPAPGGPPAPPPPAGRTSTVYTADGAIAAPGGAPPAGVVAAGGGATAGGAVAGAPGKVELIQCRFDKVEAALTAAKGKVVLVDCWARWCGPCISSFPKLMEKHEKYGPKGLVCMTISIDSGRKQFNPDQVLAFLKEKNATFPNFYLTEYGRAENDKLVKSFGYKGGIPHAALFNKQGSKIWDGHPLELTVAMIEAELAK